MSRPHSRRAPPGRRLYLELLEDRRLLSAAPVELPGVVVESTHASDRILVRFLDAAKPVALTGTTLGKAQPLVTNLFEVDLAAGTTVDWALAAYRKDARVAYAEADAYLGAAWTPNDPYYNLQSGLKNTGQTGGTAGADINAPPAWGIIVNANRIPVAVFDTGIDYTHPDLYENIWINQKEIPASRLKNLVDYFHDGYISMRDLNDNRNQGVGKIADLNGNGYIDGGDLLKPTIKDKNGEDTGLGGWADGISQDKSGYLDDLIGWNSNANNNNPMDGYGHGTHVAGIIGAMGNNGVGVAGVAWYAQLVPVKFFDDHGNGSISQFIDGLNWALVHGIKLSNNSWTDGGYTPALYDAIKAAQAKGMLLIIAAGNGGANTDVTPAYPADFGLSNIVSVGATDANDKIASFSNYGAKSVSIFAPGVNVISTLPNGQYGYKSGTSMAAPEVTGAAALVWATRPEWTYQQVVAQLLNTATRLSSLTGKTQSGRLDVYAAIQVPKRNPNGTSAVSPPKTATASSSGALKTASIEAAPYAATFLVASTPVAATPRPTFAPVLWAMPPSSPVVASSYAPPAEVSRDSGLSLGLAADVFGSLQGLSQGSAMLHRAKPSPETDE